MDGCVVDAGAQGGLVTALGRGGSLRLEAFSPTGPRAGLNPEAALRADIRRLGDLLEQSLARQEGPELPALVGRIRNLTERSLSSSLQAGEELRALLDGLDLGTTIRLVRAFSAHSRLATVAQQVHQVGELTDLQHHRTGRLGQTVDRILDEEESPELIARIAGNLELRPVFTAHPTEAARRSVLSKLRHVARLLVSRSMAPTATEEERAERRIAEVIDAMWQTDELRQGKPEPREEASSVLFYLDELYREVVPDLLEDLDRELARLGVALPLPARPLRFGNWVGGDRDGNPFITPEVTLEVLASQHERGIAALIRIVEDLYRDLSSSVRFVGISPALSASLKEDESALPEVFEEYRRLHAEEPYRLKCCCIRQRLRNTAARLREAGTYRPGREYAEPAALLADLALMEDSLHDHRGDLLAGLLRRAIRTAAALGFGMATMDVREHASAHHAAVGELFDFVGALPGSPGTDGPYASLQPAERSR
ncbi:MAG: phosphoenolpyruvate carboxylase, partial [Candidatus Dormibacteria bacterium]